MLEVDSEKRAVVELLAVNPPKDYCLHLIAVL